LTTVQTVQVGPATLMLGDTLEALCQIPDSSVDVVLTDPPYCSGATREAGRTSYNKTMTAGTHAAGRDRWFGSDSLSTSAFVFLLRSCAVQWQRVLKPGGHVLVFIDWRMADAMAAAIESADLRRLGVVVWDKVNFTMGTHFRYRHEFVLHFSKGIGTPPLRKDVPNILQAKAVGRDREHPTEKPVGLLEQILSVIGPEDGTVLDCFAGSFSTVAAALAMGRKAIGIERDSHFFHVGRTRIEMQIRSHFLLPDALLPTAAGSCTAA